MPDRILVFARRGYFQRLPQLAEGLGFGGSVDLVSDERLVELRGGVWWKHARPLQSVDVEKVIAGAVGEWQGVQRRCRHLRGIEFADARRLIEEAIRRWLGLLDSRKPGAVLSLPVDSFVLDTFRLCCEYLGVPFLAVVGSPFPGRLRFTDWQGTLLGSRPIDKEIAEGERQRLGKHSGTYKPDWLIGLDRPSGTVIRRRRLIDAVKPAGNLVYRRAAGDPESYSFPRREHLQRRMFATPSRAAAASRWERAAASARALPRDYIFLPLQFYPECSTDYWTQGPLVGAYHPATLEVVRSLTTSGPVVVKEHPAAIGRRSARFLDQLLSIPGVHPVPVQAPVSELWPHAAATVGIGSTTMLQVLAGGGNAVFLGSAPFYGQGAGRVSLECQGDELRQEVAAACRPADSEQRTQDNLSAVQRYLEATAEGSLGGFRPLGERAHAAGNRGVLVSDELRDHFVAARGERGLGSRGELAR
ncbi:MAG: hypothetical protein EA350_14265 [Gemmatimonadales bacterium]|nr:MAG: hypothetical protein EA350_14265 [Gemmatimonadales bacterium]